MLELKQAIGHLRLKSGQILPRRRSGSFGTGMRQSTRHGFAGDGFSNARLSLLNAGGSNGTVLRFATVVDSYVFSEWLSDDDDDLVA